MTELADVPVSLRCAEWTHQQRVDPIGTAGVHDVVLLVSWPMPWPRDVSEIAELTPLLGLPGHRTLLVEAERSATAVEVLLTRWTRSAGGRWTGRDRLIRRDEFTARIEELAAGDTSVFDEARVAPTELLVCGHGKRDRCCGSLGTKVVLAAHSRWPDTRVRRCSHTGGHRFAPTAITFPSGHMWAHVDDETLDAVVTRSADASSAVSHLRGAIGLAPAVQVADRAALAHFGWSWIDRDVEATVISEIGEVTGVELRWADPAGTGSAVAQVVERRRWPVPKCGLPLEAATETCPEYELVSFAVFHDVP